MKRPLLVKALHILLQIRYGYSFEKEKLEGSIEELFDYESLINDGKYIPKFSVFDNNMYGICTGLLEYAGLYKDPDVYIEHGLFFGNYLQPDQRSWYSPKFLTMGNERAMFLKNKFPEKQIHAIGPYIHYVNSFIDDNSLNKLKINLGKVLLLIPSHSTKNVEYSYDIKSLDDEIEKIDEKFDSKIVCLYFIDAQNKETVNLYKGLGYKVFCAGTKYEQSFLSRLKSIMLLSDLIVTNNISTHLGYCTTLGKRVLHVTKETKLSPKNDRGIALIDDAQKKKYSKNSIKEITEAYSEYSCDITSNQLEIANKFWGLDQIKSEEEIRKILQ